MYNNWSNTHVYNAKQMLISKVVGALVVFVKKIGKSFIKKYLLYYNIKVI